MPRLSDIVQWRTIYGDTIHSSAGLVTPEARLFVLRLPFVGFSWQRPTAVQVVRDGANERILIPDPTRVALAGLIVITTAVVLLVLRTSRVRYSDDE